VIIFFIGSGAERLEVNVPESMGYVFVLFMTHSVSILLLLWRAVATFAEGKSARVEKCVCLYLWCSAGVTKLRPVAGKGQEKRVFW